MAKKTVRWTEFHNYETEIEVPDGLDICDEREWIEKNTGVCSYGCFDPYDISLDWESFDISDK